MDLHELTIPVFAAYLENLAKIIEKAKRHAAKGKVPATALHAGRLAPDMYTFMQQIGYAYFMALETATNLSGAGAPKFTYDEKDLGELQKSLRRAAAFLKKIPKSKFKGADKKKVATFLIPNKKIPAKKYVLFLALPNFFFHVTTAYDILRHMGVPLKKDDYLGR